MTFAAAAGATDVRAHRIGVFAGLVMALLAAMLVALGAGRYALSVPRILEILWQTATGANVEAGIDERILLLVRLPRILMAALIGAGLAVAGAALQGVFRNPLVAPQVLGISQGAAFGGALVILAGAGGLLLVGASFGCGLAALAIVGAVSRINGRTEVLTVILSGMIVGALFAALVSLLQFFADPNSSLPAIVYWLMGSFSTTTWARLAVALPGTAAGIVLIWALRYRLNLLALDDAEARSLGVRPDRERWIVFTLAALIVGTQVAVSGVIGWIGLVIPHAARLLVGEDHRVLIPASALVGAAYLVTIDTLARTMTAAEIPLGVLTALIGAPIFAVLLRRHFREASRV